MIGVIVEAAETDFAVSLKKLLGGCCIFAFDGFEYFLSLNELIELFFCLVLIPIFEILENGGPKQV